ncbi:putative ccch zinc finger protein [Eutypa lata UCREL1]|uniref:Putative ccch zinc finger protein n=1 Tax=Eutypa lata (strain UCR-EL1) TaxID=1287681 RepID=M7SYP3_EUTLA|nr:putative ccch zinc finger protein [Eutypa lata UCREL1]
MQLINSTVYEKEAQSRSNAIEQTHRHKQLQKDNQEKAQFANFARQHAINATAPPSSMPGSGPASRFEILIDGISFQVLKGGNKLVKLPGDINPPNATPKVAFVGDVKFHRTRNGNLVRHGIVKAQQLVGGVKKVNEQCKTFSWNGIVFLKRTGFAYLFNYFSLAVW